MKVAKSPFQYITLWANFNGAGELVVSSSLDGTYKQPDEWGKFGWELIQVVSSCPGCMHYHAVFKRRVREEVADRVEGQAARDAPGG